MGFGFNLLFIFVIVPLSIILSVAWIVAKKRVLGILLGVIWSGIISLIILVAILDKISNNKGVRKNKIYGTYIIDRSKFPGKQSDWQYENYRFEINRNNELIFNYTDKELILDSDTVKIEFIENKLNDGLKFSTNTQRHHIIKDNPTLYRKTWSFYYVFRSNKFGNVFFTKGNWKPLEE